MTYHPNDRLNPADFDDIFRITDDLIALRDSPRDLTKRNYRNIMEKTCKSLTRALNEGLDKAINSMKPYMNDFVERDQARGIFERTKQFTRLLEFEEEALRECGASDLMAKDVVKHLAEMRKTISINIDDDDFDAKVILASFQKVKNEICGAASQINETLTEQEARHEITKSTLFVSGSVLVIATVAVATGGIALPLIAAPPVFLTASGALGGYLINVSGKKKDPLDKKLKRRS